MSVDIFGSLLNAPGVQAALLGTGVKVVVEFLKKFFLQVDQGTQVDQYKVPLQLVTIVCTALATLASLASQHQLSTFDPNTIVNFFTVALPAYLASLGVGPATTSAVNQVKKIANKS